MATLPAAKLSSLRLWSLDPKCFNGSALFCEQRSKRKRWCRRRPATRSLNSLPLKLPKICTAHLMNDLYSYPFEALTGRGNEHHPKAHDDSDWRMTSNTWIVLSPTSLAEREEAPDILWRSQHRSLPRQLQNACEHLWQVLTLTQSKISPIGWFAVSVPSLILSLISCRTPHHRDPLVDVLDAGAELGFVGHLQPEWYCEDGGTEDFRTEEGSHRRNEKDGLEICELRTRIGNGKQFWARHLEVIRRWPIFAAATWAAFLMVDN